MGRRVNTKKKECRKSHRIPIFRRKPFKQNQVLSSAGKNFPHAEGKKIPFYMMHFPSEVQNPRFFPHFRPYLKWHPLCAY